jgi:hypothetical protein
MSLRNVFARMSVIEHLESGPLGSYLSGLASALGEQRYAVHTIQKCLRAVEEVRNSRRLSIGADLGLLHHSSTAIFMWMNSHRRAPQDTAGHNNFSVLSVTSVADSLHTFENR